MNTISDVNGSSLSQWQTGFLALFALSHPLELERADGRTSCGWGLCKRPRLLDDYVHSHYARREQGSTNTAGFRVLRHVTRAWYTKKNPAHTHEWLDRSSPVIQKAAYEALRVSSVTSFCHSLSPKVADRVSRPRLRHPAFPEETSLLLPMGRRRHQGSGKLTSCFGGRNSELPLHQLLICLPTSPSHMDSCGFNAPRPRTA